jgi:hypothetical protein
VVRPVEPVDLHPDTGLLMAEDPVRGEIVEFSGRGDHRDVTVSGGCLISHDEEIPSAASFVVPRPTVVRRIAAVMGVRASGIPPAEASRDERSETAHAHLPADISSSTVQLGARGEIGENSWSPQILSDFSIFR